MRKDSVLAYIKEYAKRSLIHWQYASCVKQLPMNNIS